MPMDPDERELQIKLAQFNSRLQIYIASVFGFLAVGAGCLVGGYQIVVSVPKGISIQLIMGLLLLVFGIFCFYSGSRFVDKLNSCKKELEVLK